MAAPRRPRRAALIGAAVILALPVLAWGGLKLALRDSVLRPRITAAVEQATGRALTLSGPVGIKLSLVPTVTLEGMSLANMPGGSRPEMLTARRVEARLALLPLLSRRIAFEQVTLVEPDLLLEVDARGRGNWRFSPAPGPAMDRPDAAMADSAGDGRLALFIAAIDIEGGRLTWHDPRAARREVLEIRGLALRAETPAAPLGLRGTLGLRGVAVALEGQAGPLARLLGTGSAPEDQAAPWPLHVALSAPGLRLVADGSATRPEAAAGWRLNVKAMADSTARLAPFLPRAKLPPLRALELDAELADGGAGQPPRIGPLTARSAGGDLGAFLPGLSLGAATLRVAEPEAPGQLEAELAWGSLPVRAEGQIPGPAALLGSGPWPLRLALRGAGATAEARAELNGPRLDGAAVALSLAAPDTAPLLAALGLPGPRLTEASLDGRLLLPAGGAVLEGLRLRAREAVLEGEARLATGGPRPALTARLNAARLDLDALLASPPATPNATPAPAAPPAAPDVPPRPPAPPAGAAGPRRVIPDLPLPGLAPRGLDGEVQFAVAELVAKGVAYRDLRGTAKLQDGLLAVEPLRVTLPGGRLGGRLGADATGPVPRLSLALRHEGAGLDLRPLLQAYGLNGHASGRLEVEADLAGAGAGLRALAASLSGHLGLAMANGQIDNRLLDRLGGDLRRMLVPNAPTEGGTPLRCIALRLNLQEGVARPQAMLLETGLADVVGSGSIDLGQEKLALRLLPQVRLGGLGLTAPVLVGGTLAAPSYRLDPAGVADATAGIVGDLVARQMENQGSVLGQLAQQLAGRGNALPDCAQQLAVARGGRAGPVPAPKPAATPQERPSSPVDLLRGLLGR